MKNPWEEIDLEIYESHMRLDSVMQLQAMNAIMKKQLEAYPAATAMILGVAGGNGLEHIRRGKYHTVYGVDINADYLRAVPYAPGTMTILKKGTPHSVTAGSDGLLIFAKFFPPLC